MMHALPRTGRRAGAPRPVASAIALTLLAAAPVARAAAQQSAASTLDAYVAEAMAKNLGLAQQRLSADQSDAVVRGVRAQLMPQIGIEARYTHASGYLLDFGQLVGPAYQRLNQLTPGAPYPTSVDLRLPLTQETHLRLVQPVYQPALGAATQLARTQRNLEGAQIDVAARKLAADVRIAYLNLAKAARTKELYESTLPLVDENVRVNERLVANGRATPDATLRARAERSDVEQRRAAAAELQSAARGYFNLLLDRPADAPVEILCDSALDAAFAEPIMPVDQAVRSALANREEFRQVDIGIDATKAQTRLATSANLPSVAVALDYGIQGSDYANPSGHDFTLASIAVQWNLFNGGQTSARRQEAAIAGDRLRLQRRELERQVTLEVMQAHEAAEVAREAITTAQARQASAARSFQLVSRRFAEGLAPLIEFLDARTSDTGARLNLIVTTYDYYARRVELDRAAALYPRQPPSPR